VSRIRHREPAAGHLQFITSLSGASATTDTYILHFEDAGAFTTSFDHLEQSGWKMEMVVTTS
jgi:hypothetical protein